MLNFLFDALLKFSDDRCRCLPNQSGIIDQAHTQERRNLCSYAPNRWLLFQFLVRHLKLDVAWLHDPL